MPHGSYEDIRIEGHLIDSGIMSAIMDDIVSLGGEFETLSFEVGRTNEDVSEAVLRVRGRDEGHLDALLTAVQEHGAVPVDPSDVDLVEAPADGVFPDGFYSTTNLETAVRVSGRWIPVEGTEMDLGVRVDREYGRSWTVPMADVRAGEPFVVGHAGLRVKPQERPREKQAFEFMTSAVSSEKPKAQVVKIVAEIMRNSRDAGQEIIAVAGPAVVHTGAGDELSRLVRAGYVSVLFGGNAVAVHDIESALYGTSLGVSLADGTPVVGGHEHHLRAINRIRRHGSIAAAVEAGTLTSGLMHTLVTTGTPYVLAGSVRDDGPLPDVVTDVMDAQRAMRTYCQRAGACLMLSTMLHSIATGNMLPAATQTVCVDINPAVVTKLADRGSWQTIGIVTDVGLFLEQLANELGC
ncbi:MAG: TIGR00300 family protein [Anaerosomatales bacterium]|nr:TIGR00300 family protein [Anaerosomatales bacterium]MDT8434177.1 TIGR00300 family protein [Anaerosomatales bacterium]